MTGEPEPIADRSLVSHCFGENRSLVPQKRESAMPQIQIDKQPTTQITIIEAEPGKQAEALSIMTERARFMARQPGFISVSLHRSLDGRGS
jgi:antibiotic biosynthesis monooxygenase